MMTDLASGIKREVLQLIELQIETLRREGRLTDSDLEQYRALRGNLSSLPGTRSNWTDTRKLAIRQGILSSPWFEGARRPPPA